MPEQLVGRVEDLTEGSRSVVRKGRLEICVFNVGGRYYALPNVCVHQFGPVCEGTVTGTLVASEETGWRCEWVHEGQVLVCPWHALEFDITTGRCLAYPRVRLRQFPVRVEDGNVIVDL